MPSHPELLDWLAGGFSNRGARSSRLHRLIVTSAVYRQSVRHEASFAAIDGDNQWLWRQNRRRLDAESVHDAILGVAGQLDPTMRGPSVQQFSSAARRACHTGGRLRAVRLGQPGLATAKRLSLYLPHAPDPFFDALDSADASQLTAVRNESTTPLQALELLNSPFVFASARSLPDTSSASHGGRVEDQVRTASSSPTAVRRPPKKSNCSRRYAARHGLANLCRLIINSNEFLYVN